MKPEDIPSDASWCAVNDNLIIAQMPDLGTISFDGKVSRPYPPDRLYQQHQTREYISREEALRRIAELALDQIHREIEQIVASPAATDAENMARVAALRNASSNALAELGARTLNARVMSGEHPEDERGR